MSEETVLFRESQYFSPGFYVIFLACLASVYAMPMMMPGVGTSMLPGEIIFTVLMLLTCNLMFMRTTVTNAEIVITFGLLFPLYVRHISVHDIAEVEPVRYEPLQDYGGWGIRGWGKRRALNARGDLGMLITLRDETKILIGSQQPQEFTDATTDACRHPHMGTAAY